MPSARTLIAHLAGEHRRINPDPARIAELREQIREAQLTEWVERQLAAFPPLNQATKDKLAALFRGSSAACRRGECPSCGYLITAPGHITQCETARRADDTAA